MCSFVRHALCWLVSHARGIYARASLHLSWAKYEHSIAIKMKHGSELRKMESGKSSATVVLADACPIRGRTLDPGGGRKRRAKRGSRKIGISRRLPDRPRCEYEVWAQLLLQCNDVCLRDAAVFPRSAPVLSVNYLHIFVRPGIRNLAGRSSDLKLTIGRVSQKTHPPPDDVFSSLGGRTNHTQGRTVQNRNMS